MTDSKETELKPCPFCGGEAKTIAPTPGYSEHWWVNCAAECPEGMGVGDTEPEAITAWNTRSPDTAQETKSLYDMVEAALPHDFDGLLSQFHGTITIDMGSYAPVDVVTLPEQEEQS